MKKILFLLLLLLTVVFRAPAANPLEGPKREMRGTWIQCVNGQFLGMSREQMQANLTNQLNVLQAAGINAVMFQVRPEADALYRSSATNPGAVGSPAVKDKIPVGIPSNDGERMPSSRDGVTCLDQSLPRQRPKTPKNWRPTTLIGSNPIAFSPTTDSSFSTRANRKPTLHL